MKEKLEKYASTILKTCLKVEKNQPLFISANYERIDFVSWELKLIRSKTATSEKIRR